MAYWAVATYGLTLMETELAIQHLAPKESPLVQMRMEFDETVKVDKFSYWKTEVKSEIDSRGFRLFLDPQSNDFPLLQTKFGRAELFYMLAGFARKCAITPYFKIYKNKLLHGTT